MKTIPEKEVPGLQYILQVMYFTNFTKSFVIRKIGIDDMQAILSILKASKSKMMMNPKD